MVGSSSSRHPFLISVWPRRQGGSSGLFRGAYDHGGNAPCLQRGNLPHMSGSLTRGASLLLGRIFCSRRPCPTSREKRRSGDGYRWRLALQGFVASSRAFLAPLQPDRLAVRGQGRAGAKTSPWPDSPAPALKREEWI